MNGKQQSLIEAVERAVGRKMTSPRDFEYLSTCLANRLNEGLSVSTLKRLWNYVPNRFAPTRHTLDVLARFVGYDGWEQFNEGQPQGRHPSGKILARHIAVPQDLTDGDRVKLTWAPDRECVVRYRGDLAFVVEASHGTRLRQGDTFRCGLIIDGEPLYLDDLRQPGHIPSTYVCGQVSGIRFERLNTYFERPQTTTL